MTDEGQVILQLRHRWADGTTHLVFDPVELLERLGVCGKTSAGEGDQEWYEVGEVAAARASGSCAGGIARLEPHAATPARRFAIRFRLKAAQAKTKSHSTWASPRSFTLRRPAMGLTQPKTRSTRGRQD